MTTTTTEQKTLLYEPVPGCQITMRSPATMHAGDYRAYRQLLEEIVDGFQGRNANGQIEVYGHRPAPAAFHAFTSVTDTITVHDHTVPLEGLAALGRHDDPAVSLTAQAALLHLQRGGSPAWLLQQFREHPVVG